MSDRRWYFMCSLASALGLVVVVLITYIAGRYYGPIEEEVHVARKELPLAILHLQETAVQSTDASVKEAAAKVAAAHERLEAAKKVEGEHILGLLSLALLLVAGLFLAFFAMWFLVTAMGCGKEAKNVHITH